MALAAPVGIAGEHVPFGAGLHLRRHLFENVAGEECERAAVTPGGRRAAIGAERKAEARIAIAVGLVGAVVEALHEFLAPQGRRRILARIHAQRALMGAEHAGRLIGQRDGDGARAARHVGGELRVDVLIELVADLMAVCVRRWSTIPVPA